MALAWFRHLYAEIVPDQKVETWLSRHSVNSGCVYDFPLESSFFGASKGDVVTSRMMLNTVVRRNGSAVFIFVISRTVMVQGAVSASKAVIHELEPDPLAIIQTGDIARMGPSKGVVVVEVVTEDVSSRMRRELFAFEMLNNCVNKTPLARLPEDGHSRHLKCVFEPVEKIADGGGRGLFWLASSFFPIPNRECKGWNLAESPYSVNSVTDIFDRIVAIDV